MQTAGILKLLEVATIEDYCRLDVEWNYYIMYVDKCDKTYKAVSYI